MKSEKVDLSTNAASFSIEVDLDDLNPGESLTSRYERYLGEHLSLNAGRLPGAPAIPRTLRSSTENTLPKRSGQR
jgi:hypothetical protein